MPGRFIFIKSAAAAPTFPTIQNTPAIANSTSPTNVTLGSFSAGDLLIVLGGTTNNTAITVTGGSGWTHATQTQNGNAMSHFTWKVAAGGDTLQLTHGGTLSYVVFVLSPGASVTTASSSQAAITAWDFPNVAPGSTKNYLYMCFGNCSVARTGSPSGFTFYNTYSGTAGNKHIWTKQSTATSEDPPSFTDNSTGGGMAKWTVAIHPT